MSSLRPAVDPRDKAKLAGLHLQEALISASDAIKTIASIVPRLFFLDDTASNSGSTKHLSHLAFRGDSMPSGPTSNKRKRKEKLPGAREKPPSAYHLFAKERKDQVKQSMGEKKSANDVLLEVNRLWKELSDELRKVCDPGGG
jgi:hypothetical protein